MKQGTDKFAIYDNGLSRICKSLVSRLPTTRVAQECASP